MYPYIRRSQEDRYDILASEDYIEMHKPFYTESTDDRYVEYKSLICLTSLALLPYGSIIMHAVAIRLDGYCWLFTAPPGTGKTTQYFHFKDLFGEAVEMVCGDMPLLEVMEDGTIRVRPTPWNGKERIKGKVSAPLGGILLLKQGKENAVHRLLPEEAVIPVFLQLAVRPDTAEQAMQAARICDRLLQKYPVWEMTNRGDEASALLAAETFRAFLKDKQDDI